jgi:hypothetical protein
MCAGVLCEVPCADGSGTCEECTTGICTCGTHQTCDGDNPNPICDPTADSTGDCVQPSGKHMILIAMILVNEYMKY